MKLLLIRTEAVPAADRLRFSSLILFQVNLQFTFTFVAHTSLDFRRQLKILSIYLVRTATNLLKVNIVSGMFIRSDKSWSGLYWLTYLFYYFVLVKSKTLLIQVDPSTWFFFTSLPLRTRLQVISWSSSSLMRPLQCPVKVIIIFL